MNTRLLPLFCLALLLGGCPSTSDDDDSTGPADDDDSAVQDDDDSGGDDDDTAGPPEWGSPDEAFATFVGGGDALGAVMDAGFDVDGDGLPELVFGTPEGIPSAEEEGTDRGAVFLFFGSTVAAGGAFDMADADLVIHGEADNDEIGIALAGRGDVDGDGLDDLAISSGTRPDTWIFRGSTLSAGGALSQSDADIVVTEQVAECVRWVGDMDGDGMDELAISNTLNSSAGNVAGRTFVMAGAHISPGGQTFTVSESWVDFPGAMAGNASGCETGTAGDVDGDGLDDLLVGTQGAGPGGANSGMVSLFLASSLPVDGGTVQLNVRDIRFAGEWADDRLGTDVQALGDLDGDGLADFLLSARNNDDAWTDAGKTYLIEALTIPWGEPTYAVAGAPAILGQAEYDKARTAVATLGDVDRHRLPHLAIGAPLSDSGGEEAGSVYVVLGTSAAAATAFPLASANGIVRGAEQGARFGEELVGAGDVDGDGRADLLVGAPRSGADPPGSEGPGRAWLLLSPYP